MEVRDGAGRQAAVSHLPRQHHIPFRVLDPTQRRIIVHFVDTDDKNKASLRELEVTEEKFFGQFAALEDSLALLQLHMRDMSENVKLFGSLAMHIRRSVCPAALRKIRRD
jgi:hypothetical protein